MNYKHKVNGIIIKILETSDKTKTVIFEKEDGKTESMTTSTLKRWYEPIEEEVVEQVVEEEQKKEDVKPKKKVAKKEVETTCEVTKEVATTDIDYFDVVSNIFKDYEHRLTKGKDGTAVYVNNRRVLEVFVRTKVKYFNIFMKDFVYNDIVSTIADTLPDVATNPTYMLTHFVKKIPLSQLEEVLTLLADKLNKEGETFITKAIK